MDQSLKSNQEWICSTDCKIRPGEYLGTGLPMCMWQKILFTPERGMEIHTTKTSCLIASKNQQRCTAQAGKTSQNQSQLQNQSAEEIHTEKSNEEFQQLVKAKRQNINFAPASTKEQWGALSGR